jgi:superfamily II DNA or RNA helicase
MAHLIHQKNINIKHRLFMTATERLFKGDKEEYLSMDDPRDYGDLIYQLSFKEAIEAKPPIIADYKIITFGISQPDIEAIYTDNKFIQIKKNIDDIKAREFATALALRKAIKKLGIKNAISFHSSIRRANNFKVQQELISKVYPEYGNLKAFHVSGDMPTNQRSSQMRQFAESKGLMTNARCLTEGVDLPAIDCVVFTDPKKSKVDIVQAAGRALRLSPGKKFGYILIPLIIPENENATEAAKDTAFEEIVATIRALAAQDTRIIEYLRAVSSGTIPKGGSPVDGITKINVLTKVNEKEFNKSIQLKVWDRIAFGNWRSYEEAKEFVLKLKIKSESQYKDYYKQKKLLFDIPLTPYRVYKNKGWKSWGEFLGTGEIAYRFRKYIDFYELKKIVRKLNFKNSNDYFKNYISIQHQKFIPSAPYNIYKNKGWKNWGDFLGTNKFQKINYWSFKKSKNYIKKFNLKSQSDWLDFCKKDRPVNIPTHPQVIYKNKGYKNLGHFIGSNSIATQERNKYYLKIDQAKKLLKKAKINSQADFKKFIKKKNLSLKIPYNPNSVYLNRGWKDWGDFLGTGNVADNLKYKFWWSEKKIVKFLIDNKIYNYNHWRIFCKKGKKPQFIPINIKKAFKSKTKPNEIFRDAQPRGFFVPYFEAKKVLCNLKLKSNKQFKKLKKNDDKRLLKIPNDAQQYYRNKGWKSWPDFLGTNRKPNIKKS